MQRAFDLLTAPIDPGVSTTTLVTIQWANTSGFMIAPAKEIAGSFTIDSSDFTAGVLTVGVTNTSKAPARFAALVTCTTDELAPQPAKAYVWPSTLTDEKCARVPMDPARDVAASKALTAQGAAQVKGG